MALPVNVRDLMRAGAKLTEEREKSVRLVVAVELDAPDALLAALEDVLLPRNARTSFEVGVVGEGAPRVTASTDAVVGVLGGGGSAMADYLAQARAGDAHVVTLKLAGAGSAAPATVGQPLDDFLEGEDAERLVRHDLGRWLAERMHEKRLALAAGLGFTRPAVAGEYVKATAWQNALIGGVTIIPGADMPLMTGNQAKMVLQIAAAYGEKLDMERAKELLAVVGGGFAFRSIARQLLDFVPGFGWALKAGVAYAGTTAMGKAAIAYFEEGADIGRVVRDLEAGTLAAVERARALRSGGRDPSPEPDDEGLAPYKLEAPRGDAGS